MSVAFDHRDAGTPEQQWADAAPWRSAPPLRLDADAVVVVAAHPDDETLGAAGLIARAHDEGIAVSVIVVTDGEASHPDLPEQLDLRATRRREVVDALGLLAPAASLHFLGFGDGHVREQREAIASAVGGIVRALPARRVLLAAPWWGDGHRDHRVLGEIACGLQDTGDTRVEVYGYPIWLWHWGDPAEVDTRHWRALELASSERQRKATAIAHHRSQVEALSPKPGGEAIIHDGMRAHFLRDSEVYVRAPRMTHDSRESSVSTDYFDEFFSRHDDPWGFESRWYERRKRSALLAALPRERFDRALELGCATGVLTAELAARVDELLAVDASAGAVRAAGERVGTLPQVRVEQRRVPEDWPEGTFDLVIVSEIAYYLGGDDRARMARSIRESLREDGVVVACHWRHPIGDAPSSGDEVHAELSRHLGLSRLVRHEEADFLLEVFAVLPHTVAEREGLA